LLAAAGLNAHWELMVGCERTGKVLPIPLNGWGDGEEIEIGSLRISMHEKWETRNRNGKVSPKNWISDFG